MGQSWMLNALLFGGVAAAAVWVFSSTTGADPDDERRRRAHQHPRPPTERGTPREKGPRKVTINTVGVLFDSFESAVEGKFIEGIELFIKEVLTSFEVYLIVPHCTSDAFEQKIKEVLLAAGCDDRMIFCENPESIVHIVRHIAPHVHIEAVEHHEKPSLLQQHIETVIQVSLTPHQTDSETASKDVGNNSNNVVNDLASLTAMLQRHVTL
eukprot:m.31593 g.31593  ORF g.31593 m.31593 type:complete len:211 (-) comp16489_c0_seq2:108-740(-)